MQVQAASWSLSGTMSFFVNLLLDFHSLCAILDDLCYPVELFAMFLVCGQTFTNSTPHGNHAVKHPDLPSGWESEQSWWPTIHSWTIIRWNLLMP